MLKNVWKSSQYNTKTKLILYQSRVLSTLLYGLKRWRMTESDLNKLFTFHTENLKKILQVQPTSRSLQPREHGYHHHAKAMEMDWTCDEKSQATSPAQPFTGHQRG